MTGPINRARARAAARGQAVARDARRPTMEPGPGAPAAVLAQYAEDIGLPLEPWQRTVLDRLYPSGPSRVDGTPAVWPSPTWRSPR